MIEIWTAPVGTDDPASLAKLTPQERQRAAQLRLPLVRAAFVSSRAFLRTILASYTGISPQQLDFKHGSNGKPELLNYEGLHFNLSHSRTHLACAVSREFALGIDVEDVREMKDLEQIARRFFSPLEVSALDELDPAARPEAFFRCWTRKEAFIKATGEGLSRGLATFAVSLTPSEPPRLHWLEDPIDSVAAWNLYSFQPAPRVFGALAWRGGPAEVRHRG